MKVIVSEVIYKNIKDDNQKRFISNGANQGVFDYGDKVIKFPIIWATGERREYYGNHEIYEFTEMQKHTEYFPKIFKISKKYIVMEKLDAKKAKNDYLELDKVLSDLDSSFDLRYLLDEIMVYDNKPEKLPDYLLKEYKIFWNKINEKRDLFLFWIKIRELIWNITKLKLFELDISENNFGYKGTTLKMLDV